MDSWYLAASSPALAISWARWPAFTSITESRSRDTKVRSPVPMPPIKRTIMTAKAIVIPDSSSINRFTVQPPLLVLQVRVDSEGLPHGLFFNTAIDRHSERYPYHPDVHTGPGGIGGRHVVREIFEGEAVGPDVLDHRLKRGRSQRALSTHKSTDATILRTRGRGGTCVVKAAAASQSVGYLLRGVHHAVWWVWWSGPVRQVVAERYAVL